MSLSRTQRLLRRFVSAVRFAEMERESRAWVVEGVCGFRSNVWEVGGIRYRAQGKRTTWGKCPLCGRRHGFRIYRA